MFQTLQAETETAVVEEKSQIVSSLDAKATRLSFASIPQNAKVELRVNGKGCTHIWH